MTTTGCPFFIEAADVAVGVVAGLFLLVGTPRVARNSWGRGTPLEFWLCLAWPRGSAWGARRSPVGLWERGTGALVVGGVGGPGWRPGPPRSASASVRPGCWAR